MAVAVAAAVLGATALAPAPLPVKVTLALPLVLVLPGYALFFALVGRGSPDTAVVLLFSIALSLAVAIIGGFAVQWFVPLDRFTWTALLGGVTVVAAIVAVVRAKGAEDAGPVRLPNARPVQILLLALALAITAAAIALARTPLPARNIEGYTVLWMLPASDGPRGVNVGVISNELEPTAYRLTVTENSRQTATRTFGLAPAERWQARIRVASTSTRIRAVLYRRSEPDVVYRRVRVLLPKA